MKIRGLVTPPTSNEYTSWVSINFTCYTQPTSLFKPSYRFPKKYAIEIMVPSDWFLHTGFCCVYIDIKHCMYDNIINSLWCQASALREFNLAQKISVNFEFHGYKKVFLGTNVRVLTKIYVKLKTSGQWTRVVRSLDETMFCLLKWP